MAEGTGSTWQYRWLDRYYRQRPGWENGTTEFHRLCARTAPPHARILEVGAGPTNATSEYLSTLGELHGVDVTDDVLSNRHVHRGNVIRDDRYPYENEYFDVVVSSYVLEHVVDPRAHLAEVRRVLKKGGHYVFRTPNLWHYVALVARITPHWFHVKVANPLRMLPTDAHDPWPTVYAMNTRSAVSRLAKDAGFAVRALEMVEKEPSYGMYARPLFLAMMAYERCVNASDVLQSLRANLFVDLEK